MWISIWPITSAGHRTWSLIGRRRWHNNVIVFVALTYARARINNKRRVCLSVCLLIRPSVCPSVTRWYWSRYWLKTNDRRIVRFSLSDSPATPVFWHLLHMLSPRGLPLRGLQTRLGRVKATKNADIRPNLFCYLLTSHGRANSQAEKRLF